MPDHFLIGISMDVEEIEPSLFWYNLGAIWGDILTKYDAHPLFLGHNYESIDTVLDLISGLIIPGANSDVPPKLYHQEVTSITVKENEPKALFEIELLKQAYNKGIPIFGVCNGMQLLNIYFGGDLIQHIPDAVQDSHVNHYQPQASHIPTHNINLTKDTLLYELAEGIENLTVNSTHHQAVGNLGNGVVASARADDGIIEAIEIDSKDSKFKIIGIEWHPEYLATKPLDNNIFKYFFGICKNYFQLKNTNFVHTHYS